MREYECKACGKKFLDWKHKSNRQYCSQKCHFANHTRIAKCPTCGIERPLQKNAPQKDFCSLTCWGLAHRKKKTVICTVCGISKEVHLNKIGKYCSRECSNRGRTLDPQEKKRRMYQRVKEYRKKNYDKTVTWKNNRRSREMNAEGSFTTDEWVALKEKHGNTCAECKGEKKLTVDHIRPLSRGGTNYIANIQPLCMPCNSKKSAKI